MVAPALRFAGGGTQSWLAASRMGPGKAYLCLVLNCRIRRNASCYRKSLITAWRLLMVTGPVMLDQREGIDYAAFKEKPQDVLITLLGLGSKPVVPPELVTSVNPSPPPPMNLLYATTFGGMSWTQPARLSACASPLWDQWAGSGSTLQIPASCLARCWSQDFPSGGRLTRLAPGIPL